jgi:murein DD-endopeptidase MepM/ murein hydrolase activator NlpD
MKRPFIYIFILILTPFLQINAQIIHIEDLNYNDINYNVLYESTIASKNRLIRGEREEHYQPPRIFSYTMKVREDIWTLIAKTSLNIDTIATLNRIDFIGMIKEEKTVYLPDLLGIFIEVGTESLENVALKYKIGEDEVLTVEDPLRDENPLRDQDPPRDESPLGDGGELYFVPEKTLSFLERVYLTGVVFHAPLMGSESSRYGTRVDPFINEKTFHGGIDIAAEEGKLVRASRWGKVVFAGEMEGYGNLVVIEHELGYHTLYGHLEEILVEQGENVDTGHAIGKVGSSGRSTGPHLHFEIRRFDEKLNPDNIPFFLEQK